MARFVVSLVLVLSILCLSSLTSTYASNGGFSIELIHRDSPKSPFFNPQETQSQRVANAFRRSVNRLHHFFPARNSVYTPEAAQSLIFPSQGEYLMSISLGTPPFNIVAIADTGSDLTWTQCKPCSECLNQTTPLFDPKSSTTYQDLSCNSSQCHILEETFCSREGIQGVCGYNYTYGDQSSTNGNLAVDTVTLNSTSGSPVLFSKTIIGCGHNNVGDFSGGSGIIGLGSGPVSLISQMGSPIDGKFSYCLVPISSTTGDSSKMSFGSDAKVSGEGVQSTPLYSKNTDSCYYLTLEAMSVEDQKLDFPEISEGNIIIDSGTTFTLLPVEFFYNLSSAVERAVHGTRADDPTLLFRLCYKSDSDLKLPTMAAHFTNADVKLQPLNTFHNVSDDVVCFAFIPIEDVPIFGNMAQMNFLVGYDLQGKTLSFKPTDCLAA